jgi:hypothetical protein
MADTLFRDELLASDRWLDLPTDTDRLAYFGIRMRADDFGNIEGGLRRMFRFLHGFTQIKTQEAAATTLGHLVDADLIRGYKSPDARDFYHCPRSGTHRSYMVRKCPPSPWCDPEKTLGKHVRSIINQGHAKNVAVTLPLRNTDVPLVVGVSVSSKSKTNLDPAPVDKSPKPLKWADFWKAKGKALGINPLPGETEGDYCRRIMRTEKERAR